MTIIMTYYNLNRIPEIFLLVDGQKC